MGCVDSIKSLGTHGYDQKWSDDYIPKTGGLQVEDFVIYKGPCQEDKCKKNGTCKQPFEHTHYGHDFNEPTREVYRSYFDPQTGYVRAFICPTLILLKGVAYTGASILRPFVVLGSEIAEIAIDRECKLIERITTVGRAGLYSVAMTFCAVGMVLFPFSTVCMVKLSEVERAANRGLHYNVNLRAAEDRQKFALFMTGGIQARGHVYEKRGNMPKYKTFDMHKYETDQYQDPVTGKVLPFAIELKLNEGNLKLNHCNYGIKLWGRKLKGDEKKDIEEATGKLVEFFLESLKDNGYSFHCMTEITEDGIGGVFFNPDGTQESGSLCFDFLSRPQSDAPIIPGFLSEAQKNELKKYSFIHVTSKMTFKDLWSQIKTKITQTSEW